MMQNHPNISKAIEDIQSKIDIVDSQTSNNILSLIKSVSEELNSLGLNTNDPKTEAMQKQLAKIGELYSLTEFSLEYHDHLESIIMRLKTLKNIHENAAAVMNKAQQISNEKELICKTVEECKANVGEVMKGVTENACKIEKSIATLEGMLKAFAK